MASVVLLPPNETNKSLPPNTFYLHVLPKIAGQGSIFDGESLLINDDWMRQCTQFFSRAYNRIDEDDCRDSADIHEEHHPSAVGKITEHHRQMSCQAIQNFGDRTLKALCGLKGPFTVDGLSASDYFLKANTIRGWVDGEKKWAQMLDEASFWLVSQDSPFADRNSYFMM
jgi:hypothetical protein